jgi:hypothetical protein
MSQIKGKLGKLELLSRQKSPFFDTLLENILKKIKICRQYLNKNGRLAK